MSASAQALYFHLGMRADDDGFVSSPRKIAKASNCGLDDLTLLAAKGFIIPFESGVVVVTHWKENNYIRADRYKPTRYTKEAEMLQELEAMKENDTVKIHALNEIVDSISDGYFKEPDTEPLYTGLEKLDNTLGGLEGGDMIVIGARPAVGKSAFVTQIAINLADRKKKIAFYNLEMSDKQVYERLLSRKSRIGLNRIRRARSFLGDEKDRFDKANQELKKSTLFIRSGAVTVSQIRNECRHLDLDCIVIDYIQLLRSDIHYQSRANEVGAISKAIKALAMELNIPIIALSQLNRVSEMRQDKVPTMGELREAGDIEQDASIILLMWNIVDDKKGLKVEKNRQGILSTEVLRFDGDNMQFIETDESIKEAAKGFRKAEEPTPFD
nr:MAG TPA: DnaB-like replicative helicase [Caudoviricetes sp.]